MKNKSPLDKSSFEEASELEERLRASFSSEIFELRRQRALHLAFVSSALIVFSVVLFFSARRYHDVTLWVIGLCLLIFGAIEVLELERCFQFVKKRVFPENEGEE